MQELLILFGLGAVAYYCKYIRTQDYLLTGRGVWSHNIPANQVGHYAYQGDKVVNYPNKRVLEGKPLSSMGVMNISKQTSTCKL
jgi:hypothetical protein